MIPLAFIEDYLSDDQAGMLSVITWFLNQVLRHEAGQQAGAGSMNDPRSGRLTGTVTRNAL